MRYIILIFFIAALASIILGHFMDTDYSEQFIGFGVSGLFLVVFPLFIYHRWKDRKLKDYMLTQENLEKMRDFRDYEK